MRKILTAFALLLVLNSVAQNSPFQQKVKVLTRFFEQNHYQPRIWDDSSSLLLYNKWMDILDEGKFIFTQKDVEKLAIYKYKLDDELKGNGWAFFDLSINLFQAKLKKVDSIITRILAKPIDISKPDNITYPFAGYALNDDDLALRWQKYLKWQILGNIADAQVSAKKELTSILPADFSTVEATVRQKKKKQQQNYILEKLQTPATLIKDMQDAYLNSIAWCYDPHSDYMNLSKKTEWDAETSASEYSAGFGIEENDKGEIAINFLQPGGSAWRSGQLHKGDILLKVKTNGKDKALEDMDDDELNDLLGGSNASEMEITVRTAAGEVKSVKLSKEKITDDESIVKSYVLHGAKNIGYINLPGFYSREEEGQTEATYDGCANDVSKEIVKLKKDTIAGLILDLRYNGGGSMWEGMQLAGIFIDIGPVASVKERDGKVHFLKDPNRGTIYDGPLIVLINGASASASEFVSAALQDYNRALIVGGSTYGKGTAQLVLPMDTLSLKMNPAQVDFIKVTQEKFYRVNGSTTQWKGVTPDISLPDMYADESFKEKANASALQPDNSKTALYQALPALPVATLNGKSRQRTDSDQYFKSVTVFSDWIRVAESGRTIPLQWDSYIVHYKKTTAMFDSVKDDDDGPANLLVTNNGFDRQRIEQSADQQKKTNDTYLKNVSHDKTLAEACHIMMDWIK